MKVLIVLLYIFVLPVILIAQNVGQKGDTLINYKDINGMKQGHWQKKYENETIAYDAYFKNDKIVGDYKRYYSNGKLKAYVKYDNKGNQTGYAILYWDNGNVMAEGKYINLNVKDSIWTFYGTDGKLVSKISYNKGVKDGDEINYYRNGKMSELIQYKDDKKDGLWQRFNENGDVYFETGYKNGIRNGGINIYYPNGKLRIKGRYVNGLKHGKFVFYDEKGEIEKEIVYKKGKAENEDEINSDYAKEILEFEKNKYRYPEPDESDFFKNNPKIQEEH